LIKKSKLELVGFEMIPVPSDAPSINKYDVGELSEAGPAGCDSDKCLLPLAKPKD